jgi:hypothetical protein
MNAIHVIQNLSIVSNHELLYWLFSVSLIPGVPDSGKPYRRLICGAPRTPALIATKTTICPVVVDHIVAGIF